MSRKDAIIDLIRRLPDDVTIQGIISALQHHFSAVEEPDWSADELTEDEWRQFVAYCLRDELNDPREDIYSEQDGEPAHG
jgi:hypothetical protein